MAVAFFRILQIKIVLLHAVTIRTAKNNFSQIIAHRYFK
jgi:hypothetical protein